MTTIHFVLPDGTQHSVEAPDGASVMQAAVNANLRGITAECGGSCQCATCHIYIDEASRSRIAEPSSAEKDLLEGVAAPRLAGSRLSCQIIVTSDLNGLVARIPDIQ